MADTVLKSVAIRNWNTIHSAELTFPERGLVLVRGLNSAAKGKMESIGSGKTSLGEAINRTLLGVRGRYTRLADFSSRRKGDTYVKLSCEHKGKPLDVEMGFECAELSKDQEGFKFTYAGEEVSRDRIDNTRADLSKLLTVSTELASWTVYLDGDRLRFTDLSERKAVEILMDALMQAPWTQFHQKANTTVTSLGRDKDRDVMALDQAQNRLAGAKLELHTSKTALAEAIEIFKEEAAANADKIAKVSETLATTSTEIAATESAMKAIKKEIGKRITVNAEAEHQAEIAFNTSRDVVDDLVESSSQMAQNLAVAKAKAIVAEQKLADMKQRGVCPTCGQNMPPTDKASAQAQGKVLQKLLQEVEAQSKASTKHAALVENAKQARNVARQTLQEVRDKAPTGELSEDYERLETKLEDLAAAFAEGQREKIWLEHGPDKSEITRCEAIVTERKKHLKKADETVNAAAASLADAEMTLRVAEYWQDAFGPTGIPNMVLRNALGPLNATARRISALMTGGTITISFATSRQLTSRKAEVAELVINVQNDLGSLRFDGNSKGESSLSELIVAETLAEVGGVATRIGYRWYDEVCPNQDEVVRRSVYAYLSEIAQRYGILVFLVSHAPEAANYADYTLLAEKTGQGTIYRWV